MGQHRSLPLYRKTMARKNFWMSGVEHRTESSTLGAALVDLNRKLRVARRNSTLRQVV